MRKAWVFAFLFLLTPFLVGAEGKFTRDLYFGMRGDADVVRLQEFLRGQGYFTYPQSTGNYFTITLQAVRQFQKDKGISPVGGYFGPQSRAAANRLQGSRQMGQPGQPTLPALIATTSPYKGKIVILNLSGSSPRPSSERMTIRNTTKTEKISVTGFRVENARHESFEIPKGHALPGTSVIASDPILLGPGDRVTITMGKQERHMNFRENICTGYFDEFSEFSPSLDHQCPEIVLPDRASYTDQCIRLIEGTGSCSAGQTQQFTDSRCATFINDHLNYNGCVRDNKNRDDFYLKRWLVWMQRDQEFFRNLTETVTVRDQNGKVVDEYRY